MINKRVNKLIETLAVKKSTFSSATGISTVILSHIGSGRNKVSLTAVEQILKAYPSVNSEWLILGKGDMFKDSTNNDDLKAIRSKVEQLQVSWNESNRLLNARIESLIKQIDALVG